MSAEAQLRASYPKTSAFVAANAGSGKTKTLVERVARLLLHGARPETVLCVTYTKAAAAEMQRRLFQKLGGWSVLPDAELLHELIDLGEGEHDLSVARRLFAKALETPGGLKVQTLHAFCEALLRRFPLEAGTTPGFRVMDDVAAAATALEAREHLAARVLAAPGGALSAAYERFAVALDVNAFEELLNRLQAEALPILAFVERAGGLEAALKAVHTTLDVGHPRGAPETLEESALAACDFVSLLADAEILTGGKASDLLLAAKLSAAANETPQAFRALLSAFVTKDGTALQTLGTVGIPLPVRERLREMQERLIVVAERLRALRIAEDSEHVLRLATAYALLYADAKRARGALDFADLIDRCRRLLTEADEAAWVLYKLDGGIEHVLLDEAQDTSPEQWEILAALTGEFFAGESGRSRGARTLFAVGDEKQSIFSFQGADPAQLKRRSTAYAAAAAAADEPFQRVPLLESWRSAPEILSFVDEVFDDARTRDAVPPPEGEARVTHSAVRNKGLGGVDLWPLFVDPLREEPEAWDAPMDTPSPESGRKRLARSLAREVVGMIGVVMVGAKGDPRADVLRPARPGDVLILVRRRDGLFEEIIRALKAEGAPVAGADRLRLSDHAAFTDVLRLIQVCLYPADDLALAEVLRSPFLSLDEDDLFALAHPRDGSLHSALLARRAERAVFGEAADLIAWATSESRRRTPFDFLGRLLGRRDSEGRSMRQRILTRLGPGAEDVLEEILSQALAAEGRGVFDLERLSAGLERANIDVKRELDAEDGGFVRVMTVHGAKGLEAPIVILPDTTGGPSPLKAQILRTEGDEVLLASLKKSTDSLVSGAARAFAERRAKEEQMRLLYVALTRARDRLIVMGRTAPGRGAPEGSWYRLIEDAFERIGTPAVRHAQSDHGLVRRYGADPATGASTPTAAQGPGALPSWLRTRAPSGAPETRRARAAPNLDDGSGPAPSPLARGGGLGRFRRGVLVHRLLQVLPGAAPEARREAGMRLLQKERDVPEATAREMLAAAMGVLEDPRFGDVFSEGSRGEASIAGLVPGLGAVSARVDRLLVTPERVLVVDFKSNRPSPDRVEDVDEGYVAQMAIYAALLRSIFPGRAVEAALVWTDGPKLTPIPGARLDDALARRLRAG